jgi:hypothetical protein
MSIDRPLKQILAVSVAVKSKKRAGVAKKCRNAKK